jgi:TPR repeat protein
MRSIAAIGLVVIAAGVSPLFSILPAKSQSQIAWCQSVEDVQRREACLTRMGRRGSSAPAAARVPLPRSRPQADAPAGGAPTAQALLRQPTVMAKVPNTPSSTRNARAPNAVTGNDPATAAALEKAKAAMGRDNGRAHWILLGLANKGNAEAQVLLGTMLLKDGDVPKDFDTAMTLFRRAADQGNLAAQLNIAGMYSNGEGVPKDRAQAVVWYRKALEQRDVEATPLAQILLGHIYAEGGYGVAQDYVQAYKWYHIVAGKKSSVDCMNDDRPPADRPPLALDCVAAVYRDQLVAKMTQAQINEAQ